MELVMGADHTVSNANGRLELSADRLERAYALGVVPLSELHNHILVELFNAPEDLNPAQIFDLVSKEFSADALLEVTRAINHLEREGLLTGSETFIEPACGVARRKELIYSLTRRGKSHLLGLILWSSVIADVSPVPKQELSFVGNGGEVSPIT